MVDALLMLKIKDMKRKFHYETSSSRRFKNMTHFYNYWCHFNILHQFHRRYQCFPCADLARKNLYLAKNLAGTQQ